MATIMVLTTTVGQHNKTTSTLMPWYLLPVSLVQEQPPIVLERQGTEAEVAAVIEYDASAQFEWKVGVAVGTAGEVEVSQQASWVLEPLE